jgi:hypothetical protein
MLPYWADTASAVEQLGHDEHELKLFFALMTTSDPMIRVTKKRLQNLQQFCFDNITDYEEGMQSDPHEVITAIFHSMSKVLISEERELTVTCKQLKLTCYFITNVQTLRECCKRTSSMEELNHLITTQIPTDTRFVGPGASERETSPYSINDLLTTYTTESNQDVADCPHCLLEGQKIVHKNVISEWPRNLIIHVRRSMYCKR